MDGDHAGAEAVLRESLLTMQRLRWRRLMFLVLLALGRLAAETEQPTRALRLIGAGLAFHEQIGVGGVPHHRFAPWLAQGRRALGAPAADAAFAEGRAMTLEQAVGYALAPEPPGPGPLTVREREVAALVADGLSNRQIAETLVVAESTAAQHIANILNKLNYHARAQIAAYVGRPAS